MFLWVGAENKAVHVKICGQSDHSGQKVQKRRKKTKKGPKKLTNSTFYRIVLWIEAENKAVHVKICYKRFLLCF